MSKHKHDSKDENLIDLGHTVSDLDSFVKKNKNLLIAVMTVIILVPVLFVGYTKWYAEPREKEAQDAMFYAEQYFALDSFNIALNGAGEIGGFLNIIDQYSGTPSANLAHYYAGVCYLKMANFQEAVNHLEEFSSDDILVSSVAFGALGDAYRELGDAESAVKNYEKAANRHPNNFTTPIFLKKAGVTYEEDLNDLDNAIKIYSKLELEYPQSREGQEIPKHLARAKAKKGLE